MKILKKFFENISILFLCIGLLFFVNNSFLPKSLYFFTFSAIIMLLLFLLNKDNKIYKKNVGFIVFLAYLIFTMVFNYSVNSLNYIIYYIFGIIYMLYFSNNSYSIKKLIDLYYLGTVLFALFTIFSALFGNLYLKIINTFYYGSESYDMIIDLFNWHEYSGIAGQTGYNAFTISIGIIISFFNIFTEYNIHKKIKYKELIIMILQIVALLLCAKRAILLYTIMTLFMILPVCINMKKKKNLRKLFIISIIVLSIGIIAINLFEPLGKVFEKNAYYLSRGNLLNGRLPLYKQAIDFFLLNPISGIGIKRFYLLNNMKLDVHNVYIQLLAENGIIGFIIIITSFFYMISSDLKLAQRGTMCKYIYISICIQILFLLYSLTGNTLYDMNMLYIYLCVGSITKVF